METPRYTKEEVVARLRERQRLFNAGRHIEGFTDKDNEIVGEVLLALGECNQFNPQQYEIIPTRKGSEAL